MQKEINFKEFPTTRYQGSKRKILGWLYENFKDLEFHTVLDACGGSAMVSYLFKSMGKSVTYNDILKFNHVIGKALIENQKIKLTKSDVDYVLDFTVISGTSNFIQNTFDNYYYTKEENQWLDNIVHKINTLSGEESEMKKVLCFYALFQASLRKRPFNLFHRKNLYIRTNDVERNFGNKVTWEKEFSSEFRFFVNEVNNAIFDSKTQCNSINHSVFDLENEQYDLVYFDIPYLTEKGKNETSDYLRCYHFLEGIVDYENWKDLIDYNSKNLRFKSQNENDPFNRKNIIKSLDLLFKTYQDSIIVFSYKIGGAPKIEEIEEIMRRYKNTVVTKSKHYIYALNKQNGNAKFNKEVLIIGQ